MMGLRLRDGIDLGDDYHLIYNNINKLRKLGMLEKVDGTLQLTPAGRPLLNAVIRDLLTD